MSKDSSREIEVKLRVASVAEGARLLRGAGFQLAKRRVFEANTLFDTAGRALRRGGSLLRIREAGRRNILTFKGPAQPGRHKDREELELEVEDARRLAEVLGRLGFRPLFRYEKYRTEYSRPGEAGVATVDETPIGAWLELEGAPAWIDRNARRLGFDGSGYVTASYYALYLDYCKRHGIRPAHMTFR